MDLNYKTYFNIAENDEKTTRQPREDLTNAFINGYVAGLHKNRVYDATLFSDPQDCLSKIEVDLIPLPLYATRYHQKFRRQLDEIKDKNVRSLPLTNLRTAFIWGYKTALHKIGQYDQVLFTDDEDQAVDLIRASLILLEKEWATALDDSARAIMEYFYPSST